MMPEMEIADIMFKWRSVYETVWPDLADFHLMADAPNVTWETYQYLLTQMSPGPIWRDPLCGCRFCASLSLDAPRTELWVRLLAFSEEMLTIHSLIDEEFVKPLDDWVAKNSADSNALFVGKGDSAKYRIMFTKMQLELADLRKCIRKLGGKYEVGEEMPIGEEKSTEDALAQVMANLKMPR
jgi:hypothetical protein